MSSNYTYSAPIIIDNTHKDEVRIGSSPSRSSFAGTKPQSFDVLSMQMQHQQQEHQAPLAPGMSPLATPDFRQASYTVHNGKSEFAMDTDYASHEVTSDEAFSVVDHRTKNPKSRSQGYTAKDVVQLPNGLQTEIGIAMDLGVLPKTFLQDHGGAPSKAPAGAQQEKPEEAPKAQPEAPAEERLSDHEAEQLVTTVAQRVSGMTQVSAIHSLVDSTDGTLSPEVAARVASELHVEPERVGEISGKLVAAFQKQSDAAVQAVLGDAVDLQDFYAYARDNHPEALKQAMKDLPMNRSTRGFIALANRYAKSLDQVDPSGLVEALKASGIDGHYNSRFKQVVVQVPGVGELSWQSAVERGYVSLGKKAK